MKADKRLNLFKSRRPLNNHIGWDLHVNVFVNVTSDIAFDMLIHTATKFKKDLKNV